MAIYPLVPHDSIATGAGTAETAQTTFVVPSRAVEHVCVRLDVNATNGDPAESIAGIGKIVGQDWTQNPFEFSSEIGSAKVGAVDEVGYEREPRWWGSHLPTVPGATYADTYEPVDALANNGRYEIENVWSTLRGTGLPTRRLFSRETSTGTAIATVAGVTLTLTGVRSLTDYSLGVSTSTVAADDPSDGRETLTSSGLEQQQMSMNFNIHAIEATSGKALTSLRQREIDIAATGDPVVITSSFTVVTAHTTAGQFWHGIGYVPR